MGNYDGSNDLITDYDLDKGDEIAFVDPDTNVLEIAYDDNSNLARIVVADPSDINSRGVIFIESVIDDSSINFANGDNFDDTETLLADFSFPETSGRGIITNDASELGRISSDDEDSGGLGVTIDPIDISL